MRDTANVLCITRCANMAILHSCERRQNVHTTFKVIRFDSYLNVFGVRKTILNACFRRSILYFIFPIHFIFNRLTWAPIEHVYQKSEHLVRGRDIPSYRDKYRFRTAGNNIRPSYCKTTFFSFFVRGDKTIN